MQPLIELDRVDRAHFVGEVVAAQLPVVLRGLVSHWPLVQQGRAGLEPCLRYLAGFDRGQPVEALLARPDPTRAFGFEPGLQGFNFLRDQRPWAQLFEQLWRYSQFAEPPALAAQSAPVAQALPGLEAANPCPLLGPEVAPRIWIGNRASVPAHFDDSHNLACVAAGRRRFTLLPPACAPLLYLSPPDRSPTPAPVSTVPDLHGADAARFPLVARALEQAHDAVLEPGDAIYIPPLWFHQVQALAPDLNVLVNYWWRPALAPGRSDDLHGAALRLAMLAFRHLPAAERAGWRTLLDHYAFGADDLGHLPEGQRGLFGPVDAEADARYRDELVRWLQRAAR